MSGPTLYRGARLVETRTAASALVVDGGTIAFLGAESEALARFGGAPTVDLAGRLVTPAFGDAHVHLVQTGQLLDGLDLHGLRSGAAVLDAVRSYLTGSHISGASVSGAGVSGSPRVVVGHGWDETLWADERPPTRAELDIAGGGAVVYLARVDVHSAVVSTALLDRVPGAAEMTGFTSDGLVSRDAHHACRRALDDAFTDAERRSFARSALVAAASLGVATLHEMSGPHLGPIADLARIGEVADELGLTVVGYWGELATDGGLERAAAAGARGLAGDLCIDGSIGSRTAALQTPYTDTLGPRDGAAGPQDRGVRYLDDEQIRGHLLECTRAGVQAGFHCIGDDGVAAAVQGLRRVVEECGPEAVRRAHHRLEHVEMASSADIRTLADLGVTASMQPAFDTLWGGPGGLYARRLGADRAQTMNRFGGLSRAGVPLALGTDSPVTPLAGWATVLGATQPWRKAEALAPLDAFAAATVGVAAAAGERGGRLAVGEEATFAVWDTPAGIDESGLPWLAADLEEPGGVLTVSRGLVAFSRLPGVVGPSE